MSHGPPRAPAGVPDRATAAVLTIGAIVSAALLLTAIALGLLGRPITAGDPSDIASVATAVVELRPWGWATIGVVAVIATPAVGLLVTAIEYAGRREALLALGVLIMLAVSLFVALLR